MEEGFPKFSRTTFYKACKKAKPETFKEFKDVVFKGLYGSEKIRLGHYHRELVIDGNTGELPNNHKIQG